jgi:hypothetical protein
MMTFPRVDRQTPGIFDNTKSKLALVTTARCADRGVSTSQSRLERLDQDNSPDGRSVGETLSLPNTWFRALKTKLTCRVVTGALELKRCPPRSKSAR